MITPNADSSRLRCTRSSSQPAPATQRASLASVATFVEHGTSTTHPSRTSSSVESPMQNPIKSGGTPRGPSDGGES
jgi:hypothetical protein